MDSSRRCEDCRRVVPGHAGDACPYCGGARLVRTSAAATPRAAQRHSSLLTAVITFCLGLSLLRLVFLYLGPRFTLASSAYNDLLWQLQIVVTVVTLIYVVLRRGEGDFKALFIISLGLFITTEAVSALLHSFGLLSMAGPCILFNMALLIYSSLTLTAAVADGPKKDLYDKCLMTANMGFMFTSALRTFLEMRGQDAGMRGNLSMTLVLSALIIYLGVMLIRGELNFRPRPNASGSTPKIDAPPALSSNSRLAAIDKPEAIPSTEDPRLKL
jgi:hypothetical protein